MRNIQFANNEYYHVCGRGLDRQNIFREEADLARFLFLILHFQSPTQVYNISYSISAFLKHGNFGKSDQNKKRSLELVSFAIMSNHFHLLIRNIDEGGISVYMHRVLMAYGKYFNAKYKRVGHVFDGPFKAVRMKNNEQLLYVSSYVHKNPKSVAGFEHKYDEYPWSSYQDCLTENRWPNLLHPQILLDQFKTKAAFKHFTETSVAKENDLDLLI